ncbi:MAG TPA: hypothetical protein H9830_13555 [Candidatus Agrococcus pullicola]|uniref:histidine kinase n=1 Tax=Candidatus Agrococcus pullicola TaxID=2838429 RepID=A0A9D1YY78_9MICO|nr:hypothetical protein [Candidatus Agrococcus pullicola]
MAQQRETNVRTADTAAAEPRAAQEPDRSVSDSALRIGLTLTLVMYFSTFLMHDDPRVYLPGLAVGIAFGPLCFWWLRRFHAGKSSRVLAAAIATLAVAGFILANSITSVGIVWAALLALCFEFAPLISGVLAVLLGGFTFTTHLASGSHLARALGEAAGAVFIFGLGIYLALLLKRITATEQERRATLADLEIANRELRQRLAAEQDLVVAEERARVAAALHDGLGHRLTSIGMSLDFSSRMVEVDPVRAREEILGARATASEALNEMRRVVRAMHPVSTDTEDPLGSLRAIAESFHSTGLELDFVRSGSGKPTRDAGLLMVRFVQEALTNVVRHSGATFARLRVEIDGGDVTVALEDNGRGGEAETGYGIPSLTERAAALGGTVTATPYGGIDGGFGLELRLPGVIS